MAQELHYWDTMPFYREGPFVIVNANGWRIEVELKGCKNAVLPDNSIYRLLEKKGLGDGGYTTREEAARVCDKLNEMVRDGEIVLKDNWWVAAQERESKFLCDLDEEDDVDMFFITHPEKLNTIAAISRTADKVFRGQYSIHLRVELEDPTNPADSERYLSVGVLPHNSNAPIKGESLWWDPDIAVQYLDRYPKGYPSTYSPPTKEELPDRLAGVRQHRMDQVEKAFEKMVDAWECFPFCDCKTGHTNRIRRVIEMITCPNCGGIVDGHVLKQ